ncbi:hypothetical protein H5410_009502 [Solanum commersonii]|uniref:Uncharacterized protein n=1 Tax=Solanum commersonii TaxID=4109 RepID=A0A9J6AIX8_SOLCO|nr:hypothetical protein H5410_009502 [Solanum commersonii]
MSITANVCEEVRDGKGKLAMLYPVDDRNGNIFIEKCVDVLYTANITSILHALKCCFSPTIIYVVIIKSKTAATWHPSIPIS